MKRLSSLTTALRETITRHGGGWRGTWSVAKRTFKVAHALGWQGLLRRIQSSRQQTNAAVLWPDVTAFPSPKPLQQLELSIGIVIHVFYPDLLDELAKDVARVPVAFVLMVSVMDERARLAASACFRKIPQVSALHIRIVPNRGRDIAPFFLTFREEILGLDVVCHIHTKKSLYTGREQGQWRRYLIDALLGTDRRIADILGMFQAMPNLGMIYPETFPLAPLWAHTWLGNVECARELGQQMAIRIEPTAYFDYPVGSMFWARTDAIRPLFELGLSTNSFPAERGQTDGTMQHALERMLGLIVRQQNMVIGVSSATGPLRLKSEGDRNWQAYFRLPLKQQIALSTIDAQVVSFDLFDTLVLRPFLHPSGARAYLADAVKEKFGLNNFATLRTNAETMARTQASQDVDSTAIYDVLARLSELQDIAVAPLRELELDTEQRLLRPRRELVEIAHELAQSGKRVVAVSDMYLNTADLRRVLPKTVSAALQTMYVSCENGWRKDTAQAWRQLPLAQKISASRWLHIGDNEHSDVQLPEALGYINPVHTLRPSALLDVVPALRSLRPSPKVLSRWPDQLWLGLVANHFSELADSDPSAFNPSLVIEQPETLGYTVLGPLVLDYTAWVARLALSAGVHKILFLSREGYLLQRVYQTLQAAVPGLEGIEGLYFLASRRGVNTPALRCLNDLTKVFASPFTGPLDGLLRARLGSKIAEAVAAVLGKVAVSAEVFLPEMSAKLIEVLQPAAAAILDIATAERDTYLRYWETAVGDSKAIVADIGYAGTIQSRLAALTGQTLGGAYFAVNHGVGQVTTNGSWAQGRFYDARQADGEPSPVLKYHLLLESILTSPDSQFSHFERGASTPEPVYIARTTELTQWAIIKRIHDGAEQFVIDVCAVAENIVITTAFDHALVQEPLNCVGCGKWKLAAWANALGVEDAYSGRGEVSTTAD